MRRVDAKGLADRAQVERARHQSVDAVFEMVERDGEVGGGIIAGALAYRLFIWLLPLALVCVAGLGFASEAASQTPEESAESLGMEGLISSSITGAARSPNRWYALLIGIPIVVWATRSMLRVLIGAHRLIWMDERAAAPKPTLLASLRLLVLLLSFGVVTTFAGALRSWSSGPGLLATLAALLAYAALWLLISVELPHRGTHWEALVPGALLFGVGLDALNVVIAYVITPWALAKEGTYGALGVAAALLVGLFLISRLAVATAVLNATLSERASPRSSRLISTR
ncbi:MAG: YhjD/YihY/BrkB family envelope integrity protein [Gaiellaceae bacterium]